MALLLLWGSVACTPSRREVVILSTNDMHAHIERFPQLATAVEYCRDTVATILVDAGDRWTGNAYVDLVEDRLPILMLMNRLGYDLAILGNHEFDVGQESLERAVRYCDFPIICANMESLPEAKLKPFEASRILSCGGVKVGFVGVVTNYGPNGHPDGHDEIFEGLLFSDAVDRAAELAPTLAGKCDLSVALTHIGLDRDRELAARQAGYHLIIGGHSHDVANEVVEGAIIAQTGKNLARVGVTHLLFEGDRLLSLSHKIVVLEGYEPHPEYQALVEECYANEELHRPVGTLPEKADKCGLANLFAEAVRVGAKADLGLYHLGGVRLDSLAAGEVPLCAIYDLDPFGSLISEVEMTPEELSRMLIAKFNDTVKPVESHRIDLVATFPYTVITDASGEAVDVRFPTLRKGESYRVAMGDYIYKNYPGLEGVEGVTTRLKVTDQLIELLSSGEYTPRNNCLQEIK